ncbi:8230_t:CDS:10 [Ambispora gerdemannii]|uniref:8230_t:CDS:1 n=1 Tax=Ambispora gerdemannii TaxID=144530 RepID=A0A9N9GM49_9GLOM|nr:8230_t:CDS:10 [Ambispora gerdemannii]
MELSNVSAQYFEATPIDGWSYLGYLEAMKPYFYNYASITSLKSSWRKSFLATLRTFEKCQDQERSEKSNKREISEYWNRIEQERALKTRQLAVKNQTKSSALDMLNVATSNQTNQVIKLSDEKYPSIERREKLDGPSSKNASSNPDPDASEEDQEEEESADEIDKFFMDKGNNEKIRNGVTSNDIGNINFVECMEESKPMSSTCQRPWVLRSGTNIIWMFDDDSFNYGFFFTEYFFDEVEKINPEIIETNRKVELSDEEKNVISILRRAVVAYAENLERVDLPVSEADFDNAFPNMPAKRFLNREELKMDHVGRQPIAEMKVAPLFSELALDKSLKSGGLPEPHKKKIYEDKVDLSVAMRDILYTFFKENSKAPGSDIHSTFVFGIHSWGN